MTDNSEYTTNKYKCPKCGRKTPHKNFKDCPATPPSTEPFNPQTK